MQFSILVCDEYTGNKHTKDSFKELDHLLGSWEKGVFMSMERWSMFLGQGLGGCVPLAREGMLEDALSTCSGF